MFSGHKLIYSCTLHLMLYLLFLDVAIPLPCPAQLFAQTLLPMTTVNWEHFVDGAQKLLVVKYRNGHAVHMQCTVIHSISALETTSVEEILFYSTFFFPFLILLVRYL